jgi:hypothetical protein
MIATTTATKATQHKIPMIRNRLVRCIASIADRPLASEVEAEEEEEEEIAVEEDDEEAVEEDSS